MTHTKHTTVIRARLLMHCKPHGFDLMYVNYIIHIIYSKQIKWRDDSHQQCDINKGS